MRGRFMRLFFTVLFCCFVSVVAAAEFDVQQFLNTELGAGKKHVVIPPGRYRVTPRNGVHLSFKDLADVEIIADGVEMVCTHTSLAMNFENCRNMRFKGMTIDYDPLPFTEARISALATNKSWVEFEIMDGFPENKLEERIEIYDPATGELRRETTGWAKNFEPLGSHRYRIAKSSWYHYSAKDDTEQVGDILVTNNSFPPYTGGHAISLSKCSGVTMEDVTLYASPCFGFIEHRCDGTKYLHCKIDRRAPSDDPVKRGFARMRSLDADAFHSSQAAKGPAIIGCTAKFQGDDCVNIHGEYHLVTASTGYQLRVAGPGQMSIEPGDPVEFLPYEGTRPPDAMAAKVEPDAPISDVERAFIKKMNLNDGIRSRLLEENAKFYIVTLDRAVSLPMGSAVCSGNHVGNGFAVKDCDFGFNRSRGILIKASKGEVTGNKITDGWMAAVLVAPEFWWFESASSSDVLIQNNVITGCRRAAIDILAEGGNGKPLPSGAHRDISIIGNTITESAWPNIHVTSTERLVVKGNDLTPSEPGHFVPPQPSRWNWRGAKPDAIVTEFCDAPVLQTQK